MLPLNLESIVDTLTGFASPIIKDKLQRSEIVIQLLKRFNLAPEHPPSDFSGVYAYALVEYGLGKPRPILELFRLEQIKQAFRKAFDHNHPSILLSEVDTFIEGYALGDEIKALSIDVRREVAAFYIVFSQVATQSRTPAEVLTNQAISSLHQKLATLTEQLDRLPTLESIRTEIARLTGQSSQVLLPQYPTKKPDAQIFNCDFDYYIERPPVECHCDNEVLKPGALIRIKAPNKMGKTSLIRRILTHLPEQEYCVVYLSIGSVEREILTSLKQFLRWLCSKVSKQLNLENRLSNYWDAQIASNNDNCTAYFEEYLLLEINCPLVLALDDVDKLFSYREVAEDFFGMLRYWYEMGKLYDTWKKLRLVLAYSTEVYVPLDINQSPFNVGMSVELNDFNQQQVLDLAQRYKLSWQDKQVRDLMAVVGGHPDLVSTAVKDISCQNVSLEKLLQTASMESGVYSAHLRHHLHNLQAVLNLEEALKYVVTSPIPVELNSTQIYKLHSMGLVDLQNNCVKPRCKLYREYFTRVLR